MAREAARLEASTAMAWVGDWRWLVRNDKCRDAYVGFVDTCPANHSALGNRNLRCTNGSSGMFIKSHPKAIDK